MLTFIELVHICKGQCRVVLSECFTWPSFQWSKYMGLLQSEANRRAHLCNSDSVEMQCLRTIISKSETDEITKDKTLFVLDFTSTVQPIHSIYITNIETGNAKDS